MFVCLYVCVLAAYLLRNGWTDLAQRFLLALSWSRGGFRPKKIWIRDLIFEVEGQSHFQKLLEARGEAAS